MMTFPCSNHGVTVCGGLLYVMGRGNPSGSVCCFNPPKNEWSALNTEYHRLEWSVTPFNEELYLIGGEDYWHNVHIFLLIAEHNALLLEELVFFIADCNDEHYLNSAGCYNPSTGQWAKISNMSDVLRSATAVAVGGKIVNGMKYQLYQVGFAKGYKNLCLNYKITFMKNSHWNPPFQRWGSSPGISRNLNYYKWKKGFGK